MRSGRLVIGHLSVANLYLSFSHGGNLQIVRNNHHGPTLAVELAEEAGHTLARDITT